MPKARAGSFGDNLRPGTGYGGEQPVKAAFASDEFDFPSAVLTNKLIMSLGDTQYFVYRLEPLPGYPLLSDHGRKHSAQGRAEPPGFQEQRFCSLRVGLRQAQKLGAALSGDNARRLKELDKTFPGKFRVCPNSVGKIKRESPAQQGWRWRRKRH